MTGAELERMESLLTMYDHNIEPTIEEFSKVITKMDSGKAPVSDSITFAMTLQDLPTTPTLVFK